MSANVQYISCSAMGEFTVKNNKGIHTRPATEIVRCASRYQSEIFLSYQGLEINAKSILGVLLLAAEEGAKVEINAIGDDADTAVRALIELADDQFYHQY